MGVEAGGEEDSCESRSDDSGRDYVECRRDIRQQRRSVRFEDSSMSLSSRSAVKWLLDSRFCR